jgi:hypothetical protein
MKKIIITLVSLLVFLPGFSQSFGDASNARPNPIIKQEKLKHVKLINDLSSRLWDSMILPHKERIELDERRKKNYALGYYAYPQGGYTLIIDYVSVVISAKSNGIVYTAESYGDELNEEQKKVILNADMGSDIGVNIKFRFKDLYKKGVADGDIITAWGTITVVPETEAEFPGGYTGAATYVSKNVVKKMSEKEPQVTVSFTVNEQGKVVNPRLVGMRVDPKAEKLLQDAILKMPTWKPAKNSKGVIIKQEFNFQFGGGGC